MGNDVNIITAITSGVSKVEKTGIYLASLSSVFFFIISFIFYYKYSDSKKVDIKKYLNLVGLYEHRKKTLGSLSGGQLQRLSLLIALIKDSKLILLDEPTASIDKKFSDEFLKILKDLARQGKTILMVTHDVFNINTYVNKVYELRDKEVFPYKGELIYG